MKNEYAIINRRFNAQEMQVKTSKIISEERRQTCLDKIFKDYCEKIIKLKEKELGINNE